MAQLNPAPKEEFQSILSSEVLRIHFQAITHLLEGHLLGYESLSRGPLGSIYESAEVLFRKARDRNLIYELEYQCQKKLLENLKNARLDFYVFLNLEPVILESEDFLNLPVFHSTNKIEPRSFVIELTERHHIRHLDRIERNINALRKIGFRIALDDVGSGYSDLDSIVEFLPDFIKISSKLIHEISLNPLKQKVVTLLLELAELSSAFLIAEGIETYEDYKTLCNLGVHFGQGYLLGAPRPEMAYQNRIALFRELNSAAMNS